ncbi:MAG: glucose dehydrogenase [Acidimicrobiia bacterium]|nr:glucose dehydrogenase [Acidimicrobiia bacterium]
MTSTLRFALLLSLVLPLGCPGGGGDDDDSTEPAGPCDGVEAVSGTDVRLEEIGSGLEKPVDIKTAPDGSERIFVAEQNGRVRVFRPGDDTANTWLDITSRVRGPGAGIGDERGLLGLAFHPEFGTNGRFYLHYDDVNSDTVVAEFTAADPADGEPDPDSERIILAVDQPAANHNGGAIHFGPDGYLYIGLGDGGGAGDTYDNGQRPDTLLAKILRVDVDNPSGGREYGIPDDNPFLDGPVADEAVVWGVRNPWKWSFDRQTGAMWIADVGQNQWEEIDVAEPGDNLGWPCREGFNSYDGCGGDFVDPVFEYGHADGISITGGYVYRGCAMPDLHGQYFFSDFPYFASSPLWSITATGEVGDVWDDNVGILIATFGEDARGELLTADYDAGVLYRMVPE